MLSNRHQIIGHLFLYHLLWDLVGIKKAAYTYQSSKLTWTAAEGQEVGPIQHADLLRTSTIKSQATVFPAVLLRKRPFHVFNTADITTHYYETDDEAEAHYLYAVLNSGVVNTAVPGRFPRGGSKVDCTDLGLPLRRQRFSTLQRALSFSEDL